MHREQQPEGSWYKPDLFAKVSESATVTLRRFVNQKSDGTVVNVSAANDPQVLGVAMIGGTTEEYPVVVRRCGVAYVEAGEAISATDFLNTDTSGKAKVADEATTQNIVGRAVTAAAADGDVIVVELAMWERQL